MPTKSTIAFRLISGLSAAALATSSAMPALAQEDWPSEPVSIIVSFPPGGASDLVARLLAAELGEALDAQFVVENRPGAGGTVAATALMEAAPDGHTLMLSNLTPFDVAPTLFPDTPYDPIEDFTHVSYIGGVYLGLFAAPSLEVETFEDLMELVRADPGSVDYGTSGVGSWGHIVSETFKSLTGTDMVHIPYQGSGPMRQDLRAEVVDLTFDAVPQNLPLVEEGVAVPLVVMAPERLETLPDTPTMIEAGHDLVAENWLGISAPAGLDPAIAETLDETLADVMAEPEVSAQFDEWGIVRREMTGEEFSAYVADQFDVWAERIAASGAQ